MTIDATKTSPEKLAEMNDSLITDNQYLRGRVAELERQLAEPAITHDAWYAKCNEVEQYRAALEKLACLGNGDAWGNSIGNCMAPLAWVEGKPVYKGDVLYWTPEARGIVVDTINIAGMCVFSTDGRSYIIENLTWTPPKKTLEVKLECWMHRNTGGLSYRYESADITEYYVRVPSEDRTVTVEE